MIGGFAFVYQVFYAPTSEEEVNKEFEKGCCPKDLREDGYIKRPIETKIQEAYYGKKDTGGMFGVVFGAAGTGKSNILRHICKEHYKANVFKRTMNYIKKNKADRITEFGGILYVELGSNERIAQEIAKTCGISIEPNILDMVATRMVPTWKKHLTLPSDSESKAVATVFPVILRGGLQYKIKHKKVPVLIIDGADLVAKNDENLFKALVEWAKRGANEDSIIASRSG